MLVGKTIGIGGAALLAQRLGIGLLPGGVQTRHVWGLAALGGVGFTVSLFVADLAYDAASLTDQAKVGIFAGALISAVVGSGVLLSGRRLAGSAQTTPERWGQRAVRGADQPFAVTGAPERDSLCRYAATAEPAAVAARATVPVLCWHQLRYWRPSDADYSRRLLICPPAAFRAQLDTLAEDGWNAISPDRYLPHLTTGAALPAKPVILSFDDSRGARSPRACRN